MSAIKSRTELRLISASEVANKAAYPAQFVTAQLRKALLVNDRGPLERALLDYAHFHSGPEGMIAKAEAAYRKLFHLRAETSGMAWVSVSSVEPWLHVLRLMERQDEMLQVVQTMFNARETECAKLSAVSGFSLCVRFGASHPKLLGVSELLFDLQMVFDDLVSAQKTFKRLVRIREQLFPDDAEESARSFWQSAQLKLHQGDSAGAVRDCQSAVQLLPQRVRNESFLQLQAASLRLRRKFKPVFTLKRLGTLLGQVQRTMGIALNNHGETAKAEKAFDEMHRELLEHVGAGEPLTVDCVVSKIRFLMQHRYYQQCERVALNNFRDLGAHRCVRHSATYIRLQAQLARIQLVQRKFSDAHENLEQVIASCKCLRGASHWEVGIYLRMAASVIDMMRFPTKHALKLAASQLEESLELEFQATEEAKRGKVAEKRNKAEDGDAIFKELLQRGEASVEQVAMVSGGSGGPAGAGWARTVRALGRVYLRDKLYDDAFRLLKAYDRMLQKDSSIDEVHMTTRGMESLAEIYSQRGDHEAAARCLSWTLRHLIVLERDGIPQTSDIRRIKQRLGACKKGQPLQVGAEFNIEYLRFCHRDECGRRESRPEEYHTRYSKDILVFCTAKCRTAYLERMASFNHFNRLDNKLTKVIYLACAEIPFWGRLAQV